MALYDFQHLRLDTNETVSGFYVLIRKMGSIITTQHTLYVSIHRSHSKHLMAIFGAKQDRIAPYSRLSGKPILNVPTDSR